MGLSRCEAHALPAFRRQSCPAGNASRRPTGNVEPHTRTQAQRRGNLPYERRANRSRLAQPFVAMGRVGYSARRRHPKASVERGTSMRDAGVLLATLVAMIAMSAAAKEPSLGGLQRKATLGVAVKGGEGGALVTSVAPASTATKAGLRAGDIITSLNDVAIPDERVLVTEAGKLLANGAVRLRYLRNGRARQGRANAVGRPLESYEGATVSYGAVAYLGGQLRDILVTPNFARADAPVVYLIQGYTCSSVEALDPAHHYHELIQGLAARGIATYRIDKPGIGDSAGGVSCHDTDFEVELGAFSAGLQTLITERGIMPARVVLFGHSMGGVEAPLLAAQRQGLRGVAVFGTVLRHWRDYMADLFRLQEFFAKGADPAAGELSGEATRALLDRFFGSDAPLAEIAAENPAHMRTLEFLRWDGAEQFLERSAAYWRGVNRQHLVQAWRDTKAPALAIYGEADFAALDDRDHRLIADVVNHYRPGTGSFVLLPRTGHGFGIEGTRADARNAPRDGPEPPYNPELTQLLASWIGELPAPNS